MKLTKTVFFFTISANLWGFCYLLWNICRLPCFWKWLMGFPDQQKLWPVPLISVTTTHYKLTKGVNSVCITLSKKCGTVFVPIPAHAPITAHQCYFQFKICGSINQPTEIESPRSFRLRAKPGIEYRKPPIDAMIIFIYSSLGR